MILSGCGLACAGTYIVDPAAPGAADSNPGSEQQPFSTVQRAADLAQAGDTVFVMAGKYAERVKIKTSGAPGLPIVFCAAPRRSAVVAGFDVHANYVTLRGFEITAEDPGVAVQLGGSHCDVLDNYIHHMRVGVGGTAGELRPDRPTRDYSSVSHNHIAFNKVYHSEYGFVLGGNDWLVENNEVDRLFMYAEGRTFDDCDYTRFFGRGCVQRYNYYHGSTSSEIRVAHVDCLQTFSVNGEIALDLTFENNTCFDFHQMCMVESTPHLGSVSNWTFRGNIVSANSPTMSGGWGPDIIQTLNVTIENNTISNVRWACIGLRGKESTGGLIRNNILSDAERAVVDGDSDFTASHPLSEYNLTFKTWAAPGETNLNGKDPLFIDAAQRNFRLRKGSPAIEAGKGGVTIGALTYPQVYYVDPKHPAASDNPGWGYPAVPLASLSKACALAQPGETVILRGGVYRQSLRPARSGVTFRAMPGEQVVISDADVLDGWTRIKNGIWSAPVNSRPKKLLRDGRLYRDFVYDRAARTIVVKGGDPRLHLFESVVRQKPLDLGATPNVQVTGISTDKHS